jgi:hypothetical protein
MLQVTERGTGALAIRDTVPLAPDTIRKYIPGVFATYHDGKRSQEYAFVPTSRVIEALDGVGFEPFAAKRAGVRSKEARSSKLPYVRHEIRFRKKGEKIAAVGGTLRELILGNSHNGTSTYSLHSGLYRLVCSNGLVLPQGDGRSHVVVHRNHGSGIVDEIIETALRLAKTGKLIADVIEEMTGRVLSNEERQQLAELALKDRWPENPPIEAHNLLRPRRQEDYKRDLWSVMNVIQENLERGDIPYVHEGKNRKTHRYTRPVADIRGSQLLNQALWAHAESFL